MQIHLHLTGKSALMMLSFYRGTTYELLENGHWVTIIAKCEVDTTTKFFRQGLLWYILVPKEFYPAGQFHTIVNG